MIYVASSWRNKHHGAVVFALRGDGYDVYDFRNPEASTGFHWSEIDPEWEKWDTVNFRLFLMEHPLAKSGFEIDMEALKKSDAVVLVLPCGRSSHLELGWAIGAGKPGFIYQPKTEQMEPELMYRMATICTDFSELSADLKALGLGAESK